jgi:hypothetical protein
MSSIIQDFMELTEGTEVPEMFNVWGGYVLVSACVSRRVYYMHGHMPIYPNIYCILVGDAGNGKSMAIGQVRNLLTDIENIPLSHTIETPEGLMRRMAGEPDKDPPVYFEYAFKTNGPGGIQCEISPMTIIASEFVSFISKAPESWINILNDIYDTDRQYDYHTKNQGHDLISCPYVTLYGALTTETSFDMQKSHIIQSGFARRTIFQFGERRFDRPCAFPPGDESKLELRKSLIHRLRELQKLPGSVMIMPQETKDHYKAWYDNHSLTICRSAPPHMQSWVNSKATQVLKLAMLTSLSISHDMIIQKNHIDLALKLLEAVESELYGIFGGAGRNELANVAVKIATYIRAQESAITYRMLQSRFFNECKPPNEFAVCVQHLADRGEIVSQTVSVGGTATTYVGSPAVMSAFRAANSPSVPQSPAT